MNEKLVEQRAVELLVASDNSAHALARTLAEVEIQAAGYKTRIDELSAALHHIAYQLPVSDVGLDWHQEWRNLRHEAVLALKGTTDTTRKPKKVEFHFDERSVVTAEDVTPGEHELIGFNEEQMKILQSYRLQLHNSEMTLKYLRDENQRVRMALMPLLESEDPAEAIEQLQSEVAALKAALAKSDPIRRIYDEGMPVLVCIHCGGERGRFEGEVQHAADCIWKKAQGDKPCTA